jgi:hypothetical protein
MRRHGLIDVVAERVIAAAGLVAAWVLGEAGLWSSWSSRRGPPSPSGSTACPDLDPLAPRSGDSGWLGFRRRYRRHRGAYLPIRLGTPARLRHRRLLDPPPRLDRSRDSRWRVSLRPALRPFRASARARPPARRSRGQPRARPARQRGRDRRDPGRDDTGRHRRAPGHCAARRPARVPYLRHRIGRFPDRLQGHHRAAAPLRAGDHRRGHLHPAVPDDRICGHPDQGPTHEHPCR